MARIKKTTVKEETKKITEKKKTIIDEPVNVQEPITEEVIADIVEEISEDRVEDNKEAEVSTDTEPQKEEEVITEVIEKQPIKKEEEKVQEPKKELTAVEKIKEMLKKNKYTFGYTWNGMTFD